MDTTTETPPAAPAGGQQNPEALKTEATELQQDIKEAKQEATQARKDGDDERADRLEASITATQAELKDIKTLLEDIKGRPFHPAPGDNTATAAPAATDDKQGQDEQDPAGKRPKKKRGHFMFGDRWNTED